MIKPVSREETRERLHRRIRKKISGTAERPRLAVFRSVKHIYAQVIDDRDGRTSTRRDPAQRLARAWSERRLHALDPEGNQRAVVIESEQTVACPARPPPQPGWDRGGRHSHPDFA